MSKRKRPEDSRSSRDRPKRQSYIPLPTLNHHTAQENVTSPVQYIQIVTGSYDRALHGMIACLKNQSASSDDPVRKLDVKFQDNFLFHAHSSALRCLATSPVPKHAEQGISATVYLASGSTDERINLYQLDAHSPSDDISILGTFEQTLQNPKNKEIGALLHHSSSINALHFVNKSKILSGAGDNTIAVARTRDWTVLSSIKAPIPQPVGRPSGDTAGPGEAPTGINDFAIHPSHKLMVSVSRGERCMRLWNLVTGKKAGVLNFEKSLLTAVGEGRKARGEGLRVAWNLAGDEFVVAFERGVAVFGMDSKVKYIIRPNPPTKVHQIRYLPPGPSSHIGISTEDGRILFYCTQHEVPSGEATTPDYPNLPMVGQLGGEAIGVKGRIKDFVILEDPLGIPNDLIAITGSSDGTVRIWSFDRKNLSSAHRESNQFEAREFPHKEHGSVGEDDTNLPKQSSTLLNNTGVLVGEYPTAGRITCLTAFAMSVSKGRAEKMNEVRNASGDEFEGFD